MLWIAVALAFAGCKSAAEKQCFDGANKDKVRLAACGELCDKGDDKACATQGEIALERCMRDEDAEYCRWMCDYGKDGKDLYCKKLELLKRKNAK